MKTLCLTMCALVLVGCAGSRPVPLSPAPEAPAVVPSRTASPAALAPAPAAPTPQVPSFSKHARFVETPAPPAAPPPGGGEVQPDGVRYDEQGREVKVQVVRTDQFQTEVRIYAP